MNWQLNKYRLYQCLKREVTLNNDGLGDWLGAATGMVVLGTFLLDLAAKAFPGWNPAVLTEPIYISGLAAFLFGGLLIASKTFSEVHQKGTQLFYLTLPASPLEKLLAAWLIRTIGFILIFFLVTYLLSVLLHGILNSIAGLGVGMIFNPLESIHLKIAGHLMVWQTIFFLGSLTFDQNAFIQTLVRIIGLFFLIFVWAGLITLLFYDVSSTEFFFAKAFSSVAIVFRPDLLDMEGIYTAVYGLAGLCFMVVSYLRLKAITA